LRTLELCSRHPDYQNGVAQENCKFLLEKTKSELEILAFKRESEAQARLTQKEINDVIDDARVRNSQRYVPKRRLSPSVPQHDMPHPGQF
jgi:hypothetical protein